MNNELTIGDWSIQRNVDNNECAIVGNGTAVAFIPPQHKNADANAHLIASAPDMIAFLQKIVKWELPATGKFWDKEETQPMSYGACYGSNGERDYFRALARELINKALNK